MSVWIVGAGVAGLACASVLHRAGVEVGVLEASAAAGGRVRSATGTDGAHLGDLGPSWVWPIHQPALAGWLDRLGVRTMPQYESGDGCVERGAGRRPERTVLPGQHGQRRPVGGPGAIVRALLGSMPAGTVRTGCRVTSVARGADRSRIVTDDGVEREAETVVLATPLRIAVRDIVFDPPLPSPVARTCENAATWMASQAKALAVYDTPFWRADGLSGRISSAIGPLVECHDHSGDGGEPAALVGFVGLDAPTRRRVSAERGEAALGEAVLEQLVRCFGARAREPLLLRIEDWARDPHIATPLDVERPGGHPGVQPDSLRAPLHDGGLRLAVAEVAEISPGLLEGAFVAGERAARQVLAAVRPA